MSAGASEAGEKPNSFSDYKYTEAVNYDTFIRRSPNIQEAMAHYRDLVFDAIVNPDPTPESSKKRPRKKRRVEDDEKSRAETDEKSRDETPSISSDPNMAARQPSENTNIYILCGQLVDALLTYGVVSPFLIQAAMTDTDAKGGIVQYSGYIFPLPELPFIDDNLAVDVSSGKIKGKITLSLPDGEPLTEIVDVYVWRLPCSNGAWGTEFASLYRFRETLFVDLKNKAFEMILRRNHLPTVIFTLPTPRDKIGDDDAMADMVKKSIMELWSLESAKTPPAIAMPVSDVGVHAYPPRHGASARFLAKELEKANNPSISVKKRIVVSLARIVLVILKELGVYSTDVRQQTEPAVKSEESSPGKS